MAGNTYLLMAGFFFFGCKKSVSQSHPVNVYHADTIISIATDKARYQPGEPVIFSINTPLPQAATVRYRHLAQVIEQEPVTGTTWQWTPPSDDFTGYMMDVYRTVNGVEKIYGSTAIDISSDWSRFPRYGFLSAYGRFSHEHMDSVTGYLSRLHINGLQFYDWDYDHHRPLAGTVSDPDTVWKDIANRSNYKSTVDYYIASAHDRNMLAMSYNLCYGALSDTASDGMSDQWYMYTDQHHQSAYVLDLQAPFKSKIYLLDPSNTGWQQYLAGKTRDMYAVYDFDGFHVDQVGDVGTTYDYDGKVVNLSGGFNPFLASMKNDAPAKHLVMNAVNQFGQEGIAKAPVDFLYSEVWAPHEGYSDLAQIIQDNNRFSNNTRQTVLTAYMDYNLAGSPGYFNTPGVLLTDAVIFSFGGAHLELGDHMLCKEYFPNDNLQMHDDLKTAMIHYYDFLAAYENLLRDGGTFNNPVLSSLDGKMKLNNWPPATGAVSVIGKDMGSRQIVHLINFTNAASFAWRDADGKQPAPVLITGARVSLPAGKAVKKIWFASPDLQYGVAQNIEFKQSGGMVSFTLPSLQYWDMVVIEY